MVLNEVLKFVQKLDKIELSLNTRHFAPESNQLISFLMEKKDIESLDLTFEKGFDLVVDSILTQFLFKTIPSKQLSIKGLFKLSQH